MYLNTNECFKISNNNGEINITRFGDFYTMVSKGEYTEKKHYIKELQYIVDTSIEILNNSGYIEIIKTYENDPNEITINVINSREVFDEFIEKMNDLHSIKIR